MLLTIKSRKHIGLHPSRCTYVSTDCPLQGSEDFLANKAGEYFTKVERDILDRENILKVMMIMQLMMMTFTCSTVVVVTEGAV